MRILTEKQFAKIVKEARFDAAMAAAIRSQSENEADRVARINAELKADKLQIELAETAQALALCKELNDAGKRRAAELGAENTRLEQLYQETSRRLYVSQEDLRVSRDTTIALSAAVASLGSIKKGGAK